MTRKQTLSLALVQSTLHWHDPAANRAHFAALLDQAGGADLVVLPEMFSTGFSMESERLAEPEDGPSVRWLREQAQRIGAVICASLIVQAADGSYRNRLIWARPDGSQVHYDKRHLFRMAGEHEHYTAGNEQLVVDLHGWRVRPLICYDLRFPVWSCDPAGTDLLLYIANWPQPRRQHWRRLLPARAIENLCYVAAVNRVGLDGKGLDYSGDSQVLDFHGELLLDCEAREGVHRVELSAADLDEHRERFPAWRDADAFTLG